MLLVLVPIPCTARLFNIEEPLAGESGWVGSGRVGLVLLGCCSRAVGVLFFRKEKTFFGALFFWQDNQVGRSFFFDPAALPLLCCPLGRALFCA